MAEQDRRPAAAPRTVEGQVGRMLGEAEVKQDPLVPLSTRVRQSQRKRLRIAALREDMDVQDAVAEALADWLNKKGM